MQPLILASASPRRKSLLAFIQPNFTCIAANIVEQRQAGETPAAYVQRLALEKAQAVAAAHPQAGVLGSDTIVVVNQEVLEKPRDKAHFQHMMAKLSGATHQVYTAVCLHSPQGVWQVLVTTDVTFRVVTAAEIEAYWASGEPQDKAGGYGIQGLAGKFVAHLSGSFFAVVGLPLMETEQLLLAWQHAAASSPTAQEGNSE